MRRAATAATFAALLALTAGAEPKEGDGAWGRRAAGAQGSRAAAGPIDAAIAAYQEALAGSPGDFEARWKLLRALRFKGVHVASTVDEKKLIFDEAKRIGAAGIAQIDHILANRKAGSVANGSEAEVAAALRNVPHAGELLYWDAVSWGEWALVFGKLAAVRQGAAERIRRQSTIVMLMDPGIEEGGGARVLGRLHHQTPRVPFLTGWASDAKAVEYLEQSLARGPENKLTKVFLAEALVSADANAKPRAIRLLREVVAAPIDPAHAVEEAAAQADALALLERWR